MTHRVHTVSYLLADIIDLSTLTKDTYEVFEFQEGSEIISVTLTVEEPPATVVGVANHTLDLGLSTDGDFFLNDIDLTKKETTFSNVSTTIKSDRTLTLQTQSRSGKIVIRALFFTPGTMHK